MATKTPTSKIPALLMIRKVDPKKLTPMVRFLVHQEHARRALKEVFDSHLDGCECSVCVLQPTFQGMLELVHGLAYSEAWPAESEAALRLSAR